MFWYFAKTWGEHDNGQVKMLKMLFYRRGEYEKGYYGNNFSITWMQSTILSLNIPTKIF